MRGLTTHSRRTPRNAKEIGRTVRDHFCTGAQEVGPSGWCASSLDVAPLVWEALALPRGTQRSAPVTKPHTTWTRQQTVEHALHHILCRHT